MTLTIPTRALAVLLMCLLLPHLRAQQAERRPLTGIVHDELGRPLDDVLVSWVEGHAWTHQELQAAAVARTDAAGRFACEVATGRVRHLEDPTRSLVFSRPGRATMRQILDAETARRLVVLMLPGATCLAKVVDHEGHALEGIRVVAELAPWLPFEPWAHPFTAARTDAKGVARIDGVVSSGVQVVVDDPGWHSAQSPPTALGEPVELVTRPLGSARGRVVDAEGKPVRGTVLLTDLTGRVLTRNFSKASLDDEGGFDLPIRYDARYCLRVRDPRADPLRTEDDRWYQGDAADLSLVVMERGSKTPAGELGSGRGAEFLVTDAETGMPIEGAAVLWSFGTVDLLASLYAAGEAAVDERHVTDGAGRVVLAHASGYAVPDTCALVVAPGYAAGRIDGIQPDAERTVAVDVKLSRAPRLVGRVVDAASKEPIGGVVVRGRPAGADHLSEVGTPDAPWSATSGEDGTFEISDVGDGVWEFRASAPGRVDPEPQRVDLRNPKRAPEPLVFEVDRGAVLAGRIDGHDELPSGSLVVVGAGSVPPRADHDAELPDAAVEWTTDGSFRIEGLAPGEHGVYVLLPRLAVGPRPLPVPVGTVVVGAAQVDGFRIEKTFDGRLARPAEIRGQLRFVGGDPPPGRLVVLATEEDGPGGTEGRRSGFGIDGVRAPVDRSGRFSLRLAPGVWRLRLADLLARPGIELLDRLELAPAEVKEITRELSLGVVRVRLPERWSSHGGILRAVATGRPAGAARNPPGYKVMSEGIGLHGRGAEIDLVLPCTDYELQAWRDEAYYSAAALTITFFQETVAPDLRRDVRPLPGEVVEVRLDSGDER